MGHYFLDQEDLIILYIFSFKKLMTLYLKSFKSIFLAIIIIVTIELLLLISHKEANSLENSFKLLNLEYSKSVPIEKFIIMNKINYLQGKTVGFVSVGDSSGLVSLNPKIIEKHLDGMRFYNGNVQQPVGVAGYRYIAEIFLKNNSIKYLVYSPSPHQWQIGTSERIGWSPIIYRTYLSFFNSNFLSFPSTMYRFSITNLIYYFGEDKMKIIEKSLWSKNNHGFIAVDSKGHKDVGECNFKGWHDKSGKPILRQELQKVKELTDQFGVKLIVILGPVSCKPGKKLKPLMEDLAKFQKNNPDVFVPMGLVNYLDVKHFGDLVHINSKSADYYSDIIGQLLKNKVLKTK